MRADHLAADVIVVTLGAAVACSTLLMTAGTIGFGHGQEIADHLLRINT